MNTQCTLKYWKIYRLSSHILHNIGINVHSTHISFIIFEYIYTPHTFPLKYWKIYRLSAHILQALLYWNIYTLSAHILYNIGIYIHLAHISFIILEYIYTQRTYPLKYWNIYTFRTHILHEIGIYKHSVHMSNKILENIQTQRTYPS